MALRLGKQYIQKRLLQQFHRAAAVAPPVKAPKKPLSFTPSIAPVASKLPKPVRGTVAPHPAKSTSGLYNPNPPKMHPIVTYATKILAGVSFVLSIKIWAITHKIPPNNKGFENHRPVYIKHNYFLV